MILLEFGVFIRLSCVVCYLCVCFKLSSLVFWIWFALFVLRLVVNCDSGLLVCGICIVLVLWLFCLDLFDCVLYILAYWFCLRLVLALVWLLLYGLCICVFVLLFCWIGVLRWLIVLLISFNSSHVFVVLLVY